MRSFLTFLTTSLAVVVPALFGDFARAAEDRSDLVIAVQQNPPKLDPVLFSRNVSLRVLYNVFDYPIETDFNAGWALKPGLATEWTRVDDTTLELKLREGVTFHDGSEMTAEDVAFSYGPVHMSAEDSPGYALTRPYMGTIKSVEAIDRYRVRITTHAPDPLLERRLAGWSAQIVSKAAFERLNDWDAWAQSPVGTGPYKVVDVATDDYILLKSHDDYWGGKPPFKSIRFKVVPELSARIAGLRAGDFDMITEVTPDQVEAIRSLDGFDVVGGSTVNHRVINLGTNSGWLADPRVRKAMSLAIDRQLIVDALWAGLVEIPNGFQWDAYGETFIADYPGAVYDPEAAKALLEEAGYDGSPIAYRSQAGYYTAELLTAQAIADMWRDVGINVDLQIKDGWGQIFEQPLDAAFNGSINMNYPDMLGSLWPLYGPTGFIQTRAKSWSNARYAEIGQALETELDPKKRLALHRETLEIFHDIDPPSIVLHSLGIFYGKRDDLQWEPYPLPYMDFRAQNASLRN